MHPELFDNIFSIKDKFHEECGVFGLFSAEKIDTLSITQFGMFALQHRGQEACGLSVLRDGTIHSYKQEGLVLEAFRMMENPENFHGNAAIGHTRYSTAGGQSKKNIQPLFIKKADGKESLSIVHNGNLINAHEIREQLIKEGVEFVSDKSDSEVILQLIRKYLFLGIKEAVRRTVLRIQGAYSVLVLSEGELAAFRDPNGIRPLCYGVLNDKVHVFSSESCGLDSVGADYVRDFLPGELAVVNGSGIHFSKIAQTTSKRTCSFEYIYFSRPDSVIEGINVYEIREKSGEELYKQHPVKADVVVGVPDSGVPAAVGYSRASGIPFKPILIKNKYIGRSFIAPTQELRSLAVHLKLNPIMSEVKGKRIVIIDDSIVRGTTSSRLVDLFRKAGALEIHFRSASPPIIAPCFLGVDTPDKKHLISANLTHEQIAKMLGVDSLGFLSVENLKNILKSDDHCFGCFTEHYPIQKKIAVKENGIL